MNTVAELVKPKKTFQIYNMHFADFIRSIDSHHALSGPLTLAVVVEDGNGEIYSFIRGPEHRLKVLNFALKERVAHEFGRRDNWIKLKLKNGLKRLYDSI